MVSHPTDAALTWGKCRRLPSVDEDVDAVGETTCVNVRRRAGTFSTWAPRFVVT